MNDTTISSEPSATALSEQRRENWSSTGTVGEVETVRAEDGHASSNDLDTLLTPSQLDAPSESEALVAGELVPPLGHVHSYYSDPESDQESDQEPSDENDDDPLALANRIRSLIETLAARSRPATDPEIPSNQMSERILRDSLTGEPVPFADAAFLSDTDLIAQLKDTLVMNGMLPSPELVKSSRWRSKPVEEKKSVWAILDSFTAPPAQQWCADLPENLHAHPDAPEFPPTPGTDIISDDSSVMLYFPLLPDADSLVELALSTFGTIHGESKLKKVLRKYRMYGTFGKGTVDGNGDTEDSRSWKFWKKRKNSALLDVAASDGSQTTLASRRSSVQMSSLAAVPPKNKLKQRVWLPSTTKMSIQALWWGYRLFLPPPVLAVLTDKEVEAAKRVAMITDALTWFFANLPVNAFPPPMQPAVLMLQKLMPYLGYLGTIITWSWDSVKSFDTGHGVILSATWLLPVALIPGTWEAYDFPAFKDDLPPPRIQHTDQDSKSDFASQLPLPPSSSLLSTSSADSRTTLSALLTSSEAATPVVSSELEPINDQLNPPELTPALSTCDSKCSHCGSITESELRLIAECTGSKSSPPELPAIPSSPLMMSPSTEENATMASQILNMLGFQEANTDDENKKDESVEDGKAEPSQDEEASRDSVSIQTGNEREDVDGTRDGLYEKKDDPEETVLSDTGKEPTVAASAATVVDDTKQDRATKVERQVSAISLKQKENLSPLLGSESPRLVTPSKSLLSKSSMANVQGGVSTGTETERDGVQEGKGSAFTVCAQSEIVQAGKQDKRKSRSLGIVGGLWRMMTGSG